MSAGFDIQNLPVAAFVADKNRCITCVNKAFCRLVGRQQSELLGTPLSHILCSANLADHGSTTTIVTIGKPQLAQERVVELEESIDFEVELLDVELHLQHVGETLQGWVVGQSHHALKGPFESLVAQTPFEVVLIQDGVIVYSNRDEIVVGQNASESVYESMHPEDREMVASRIAARERGEKVPNNYRFRRILDNKIHWKEVWSYRVRLNGRPAVQAVTLDVTERVRTENRLAETAHAYHHTQKMQAIGRLTGGVAHDFNNLLTIILSSAELGILGIDTALSLNDIRDAAERASQLTTQLLSFQRSDLIDAETTDLKAVSSAMQRMLERIVGEHIEMTASHCDQELWVALGKSRVEQILANLVINACDAMPDGGALHLETFQEMRKLPQAQAKLPFAVLSIRDDGTGIPKEVRDKILTPFFTTKAPGHGTGLGLSIVDDIAKSVGGAIEIESQEDVGTAIRVFLPMVAPPSSVISQAPNADFAQLSFAHILLVEDEDRLRSVIQRTLHSAGLQITSTSNALDALALLEDGGHQFDLILSDLVMPGISGFQLGQQIANSEHPTPPIVYMTGYADDRSVPEGLVVPANAILNKPFSPGQLVGFLAPWLPNASD